MADISEDFFVCDDMDAILSLIEEDIACDYGDIERNHVYIRLNLLCDLLFCGDSQGR